MLLAESELTSQALALRAPCPKCWARPHAYCIWNPSDHRLERYLPKYHWARLERVERHMPGLARQVYLREIKNLRHIDLLAIAIRRHYHEQTYPIANYQLNQSTSREELIRVLLPGAT